MRLLSHSCDIDLNTTLGYRKSKPIISKSKDVCVLCTDIVFLLAGDGVAADLSVLDGRQVPD